MANFVGTCTDLTILSGGTTTRWVSSELETGDSVRIGITAPGTLDAGTYVIQVSFDGVNSAGVLNTGSADVVVAAAGKHVDYEPIAAPFWRISGPSAGANRVFKLTKISNPL